VQSNNSRVSWPQNRRGIDGDPTWKFVRLQKVSAMPAQLDVILGIVGACVGVMVIVAIVYTKHRKSRSSSGGAHDDVQQAMHWNGQHNIAWSYRAAEESRSGSGAPHDDVQQGMDENGQPNIVWSCTATEPVLGTRESRSGTGAPHDDVQQGMDGNGPPNIVWSYTATEPVLETKDEYIQWKL
jgi:hypothetical protein